MAHAAYTFTPITVAGATGDTVAGGINDAGTIVGYSIPGGYDTYPKSFIDTGGTITPAPSFLFSSQAAASGINASGQIVGTAGSAPIGIRAFLLNPDGTDQIITSVNGAFGSFSRGFGINDSGEAVGVDLIKNSGFLWQNGTMAFIQVAGATLTEARGISDDGTIVGLYTSAKGATAYGPPTAGAHAFIDHAGRISEIKVPGAVLAEADAISANGKIVAGTFVDAVGHSRGWLQENGHIKRIDMPGTAGTSILGVNDQGAIVGSYLVAGDPVKHAFVGNPTHG